MVQSVSLHHTRKRKFENIDRSEMTLDGTLLANIHTALSNFPEEWLDADTRPKHADAQRVIELAFADGELTYAEVLAIKQDLQELDQTLPADQKTILDDAFRQVTAFQARFE